MPLSPDRPRDPGAPTPPTPADVEAAAERIAGVAHRTPVVTSRRIDAELGLRLERPVHGRLVDIGVPALHGGRQVVGRDVGQEVGDHLGTLGPDREDLLVGRRPRCEHARVVPVRLVLDVRLTDRVVRLGEVLSS